MNWGALLIPAWNDGSLQACLPNIREELLEAHGRFQNRGVRRALAEIGPCERTHAAPGSLQHTEHARGDRGRGMLASVTNQLQLGKRHSGPAPWRRDNPKSLDGEVRGRGSGGFVMPIADHDVLRNLAKGGRGAADAGFPFAQAGDIAVQKSVTPHPHRAARSFKVVV